MPKNNVNLCGKLLIAMPGMGDPRFAKAVIYIWAHSDDGAMGVIVNKPAVQLNFPDMLKQLKIEGMDVDPSQQIHFGGPVEMERGFVLHSLDYQLGDTTLKVDGQFGMTATRDVLKDMAQGAGPKEALLALGYSGWGAGQLENEMLHNGWLSCDASAEVVFDTDDAAKWSAALKSMGVNALMLSATAGHA